MKSHDYVFYVMMAYGVTALALGCLIFYVIARYRNCCREIERLEKKPDTSPKKDRP